MWRRQRRPGGNGQGTALTERVAEAGQSITRNTTESSFAKQGIGRSSGWPGRCWSDV